MSEHVNDTIVERPWGHYIRLYQESGVWVKRVCVEPRQRISLQRHHKRSEKWVCVKGEGVATVNETEIPVFPGVTVDVPVEADHRMSNLGEEKLIFIEVATGPYLGEDDITRVEDDYQR